jgi:DNA-directed RNA polymerase specialized sigma24 family protein
MQSAQPALWSASGAFHRRRRLGHDAVALAAARAWETWRGNRRYFLSAEHHLNWLKQTAYWHSVDGFRKAVRSRERPSPNKKLEDFADAQSGRQRSLWSAEDQQAVWLCVQRLPRVERFVIEGRYYDNLTDRDLAKVLYANPAPQAFLGLRVWHLRQKALVHLRQLLQQEGVGPGASPIP